MADLFELLWQSAKDLFSTISILGAPGGLDKTEFCDGLQMTDLTIFQSGRVLWF